MESAYAGNYSQEVQSVRIVCSLLVEVCCERNRNFELSVVSDNY